MLSMLSVEILRGKDSKPTHPLVVDNEPTLNKTWIRIEKETAIKLHYINDCVQM